MTSQVVIGAIAALCGGALVAVINYISSRQINAAQAEKARAETEHTKVGTKLSELELTARLSELGTADFDVVTTDTLPKAWHSSGMTPANYEMRLDRTVSRSGNGSAHIKSVVPGQGFGTIMQRSQAGALAGKRVRMTGYVKSSDLSEWAGIWLRVDDQNDDHIAIDNMCNRRSLAQPIGSDATLCWISRLMRWPLPTASWSSAAARLGSTASRSKRSPTTSTSLVGRFPRRSSGARSSPNRSTSTSISDWGHGTFNEEPAIATGSRGGRTTRISGLAPLDNARPRRCRTATLRHVQRALQRSGLWAVLTERDGQVLVETAPLRLTRVVPLPPGRVAWRYRSNP